ncbi:MAG: hypothetical protein WCQ54_02865 [Clostridiaceae bacterium]
MSEKSRKKYVSLNIAVGTVNQMLNFVLQFICRTIFIRALGAEYLGISGLFSNVLNVLSLADLGFGTAIIYSMYKPLAEDDTNKLAALMTYYKKVYNILAVAVAIIGISIVPILPYIIKLESNIPNLIIYYLMYVANIVMSYLLAYRSTIIAADQKSYLLSIYTMICTVVQNVLQIIILVVWKNYLLYLSVAILSTFILNLFQANKAKKLYPYVKEKRELDPSTKKGIMENVKSMFLYKLGGVIMNDTDNILISAIVGTIYVGLYSNYLMVIYAVSAFTNIIFNSMAASIGNLNTTMDKERQYEIFNIMNFIAFWIFGFCSACFIVLFNDFITLWVGAKYTFDMLTVIIIILNFCMPGTIRPVTIYRDTTGMFKQTKFVFLITAAINIVLSIILGKTSGVFGILLATIISRLLTNMWYEPYVLFKKYFKKKATLYFRKQIVYWMIIGICCGGTYLLCRIFNDISYFNLIVKLIICIIVPNMIIIASFYRSKEFKYIYEQIIEKVMIKCFRSDLYTKKYTHENMRNN